MPVYCGCTLPGTTPHTPGTSVVFFAIAMMHVDVPTTFTTSPSRQPAPMRIPVRVERAHGNRNACAQPQLLRPLRQTDARRSDPRSDTRPPAFRAPHRSSGSTFERNSCGGSPPHFGFHIHLWPIAQTLRFTCSRIGDPAQRRRHHVAVLERSGKLAALLGIVAQPVQQLRKSPLVRVHAAAPLDRLEVLLVRQRRDLLRLCLGAVIAPQVVLIERLQFAPTGTTLDPVVSSAIAATASPPIPASAIALRVAITSARIWSACDCVA